MVDDGWGDKVAYWMGEQRKAYEFLSHARELGAYYDASYVAAWFERHRFCFQQIVRHRL